MKELPDSKVKGLRLFDSFQRTHAGISGYHEPLFCFLNRSAWDRSDEARRLCEKWFERYKQDASDGEITEFRRRFRDKHNILHYSAWFELLVHQLLAQLGASIKMHPNLPDTSSHPDLIVSMDGSSMIVEATVVAPDDDRLSVHERDVVEKLYQLKSEQFWLWIEEIKGTLKSNIPKKRFLPKLQRFLREHDPDQVQEMIDKRGYHTVPQKIIESGNWKMRVSLRPISPNQRGTKKNIVNGPIWAINYGGHVSNVREKIREKSGKYGQLQDPFVIALNSYSRDASFDLGIDAKNVLFGDDGVWGRCGNPRCKQLAGVLFFKDTNSFSIPSTEACLYINPFAPSDVISRIPKSLYRFPHVKDGNNLIQGESVPSLLGLP